MKFLFFMLIGFVLNILVKSDDQLNQSEELFSTYNLQNRNDDHFYQSNMPLNSNKSLRKSSKHSSSTSYNFTFLTLGDWGGAALGGQDTDNVYAVAAQLATSANDYNARFIVNTGDNFYWCGITDTSDFQIQTDFLEPYNSDSLQVRWYSSLGNHEYGYNVDAQIEYTSMSPTWFLPSRYYYERITIGGMYYISLIVIDTSPCVSDYRQNNPDYWDPCSSEYPTCSQQDTDDDFEGECEFHHNIIGQSCIQQYNWFKSVLLRQRTDHPNDWVIVVGHHPIDELDVQDFTGALQESGFSIYLNGHTHLLNQYTLDYSGVYVTSGAGALVDTVDQTHSKTKIKLEGGNIATSSSNGHTYQTVFTQTVAGFTRHIFAQDFSTLTTEYVTYTGEVIHSFTSNKKGEILYQ
eukprot:gene5650-7802_t